MNWLWKDRRLSRSSGRSGPLGWGGAGGQAEPPRGPSPGATVTMTQLLWPGAAVTMTQLLWLQPCILPSPQRAPGRAGWPHGGPRSPGRVCGRAPGGPPHQVHSRGQGSPPKITRHHAQKSGSRRWGEGSRLAQRPGPPTAPPHLRGCPIFCPPRSPGTRACQCGLLLFRNVPTLPVYTGPCLHHGRLQLSA